MTPLAKCFGTVSVLRTLGSNSCKHPSLIVQLTTYLQVSVEIMYWKWRIMHCCIYAVALIMIHGGLFNRCWSRINYTQGNSLRIGQPPCNVCHSFAVLLKMWYNIRQSHKRWTQIVPPVGQGCSVAAEVGRWRTGGNCEGWIVRKTQSAEANLGTDKVWREWAHC